MAWRKVFQVGLVLATFAIFFKIKLHLLLLGRIELWDFDIYYRITQDVLAGASPYSVPYMQTAGPPAVLIFFLPFVVMSLPVARGVMIALSVVAAFGSCYLLARSFFKNQWLVWALGMNLLFWISFLPRYNLNVGQPNLILMFLITLVLTTQNHKLKTVLLSALVLIKTFYAAVLMSLLRSERDVILKVIGLVVAICMVALPVIRPDFYKMYIEQRVGAYFFSTPVVTDVDYYNQSLRSTTARLGLGYSYVSIMMFVGLIGGYLVVRSQSLSAGILFSLLLSPVVWQHYLVVVYPIVFLMVYEQWQKRKWSWLVAVGASLLMTHLPWLHGKKATLLDGIMASHFYFSLVVLFIASVQRGLHDTTISNSSTRVLPVSRKIKTTLRHSWLNNGTRQESVAEHTWMMSLLALVLLPHMKQKLDTQKVLTMIVVHDLAEAITDDMPVWEGVKNKEEKFEVEKQAIEKIFGTLDEGTRISLMEVWEEYEIRKSPEALFVKALDTLDVIAQHNVAPIETWDAKDFLWQLSPLQHSFFNVDDLLVKIKERIDEWSIEKVKKADSLNKLDQDELQKRLS